MAKERPAQVGISLEGVIYEASSSTSILVKLRVTLVFPWWISVMIDLMGNATAYLESGVEP